MLRLKPTQAICGLLCLAGLLCCLGPAFGVAAADPDEEATEIDQLTARKRQLHVWLWQFFSRTGNEGVALEHLRQAALLEPHDLTLTTTLATALHRLGRFDELIETYERLSLAHPDWAEKFRYQIGYTYYDAAEARLKDGKKNEALVLLKKHRDQLPPGLHYATHSRSAKLLAVHGHLDEAVAILEEASSGVLKNDFDIHRELGRLYVRREEWDKAIPVYESLLEGFKQVPREKQRREIYRELVGLYGKTGAYEKLQEHAMRILTSESPDAESLQDVVYMLYFLGHTHDDKYSETFMPLLAHRDPAVAKAIIGGMASGGDPTYVPPLVLRSLDDERREVALAAISACGGSRGDKHRDEVHARLRGFFEGDDAEYKLAACGPLIHDFHDEEAVLYALETAQDADGRRANRAVNMLGNRFGEVRPAPPEVLEVVDRLLQSDDKERRYAAFRALDMYDDEAVVRRLVDCAVAADEGRARGARYCLTTPRRDWAIVVRVLRETLDATEEPLVRTKIQGLLGITERNLAKQVESQ